MPTTSDAVPLIGRPIGLTGRFQKPRNPHKVTPTKFFTPIGSRSISFLNFFIFRFFFFLIWFSQNKSFFWNKKTFWYKEAPCDVRNVWTVTGRRTGINAIFFFSILREVWPDWAIYRALGNFLKHLATIILPESPTFLGNFLKVSKSLIFKWNYIWATFIDIWQLFTGHTDCKYALRWNR